MADEMIFLATALFPTTAPAPIVYIYRRTSRRRGRQAETLASGPDHAIQPLLEGRIISCHRGFTSRCKRGRKYGQEARVVTE